MTKICIKKSINIFIMTLSIFIFGCNFEKKVQLKDYQINNSINQIIDIYVTDNKNINSDDYLLLIQVVEKDNYYFVVIDNAKVEQFIIDERLAGKYLSKYLGFDVITTDSKNRIGQENGKTISMKYTKFGDEIIPTMYNGNSWEIHVKNNIITDIFLASSKEDKTVNLIREVEL